MSSWSNSSSCSRCHHRGSELFEVIHANCETDIDIPAGWGT